MNKKTRPKSWGEQYRDSTQVNGSLPKGIISIISISLTLI